MPEYMAELKRKQHVFANVNEEWLSYKAISGYQAVQKQLEAANKHKGEIGLDHKYPRVEKAKDLKRRVSGKLQEANQAKIKENAFTAYKTLIEENHIVKRFAKKVKGALIANRALNFPPKMRSDLLNLYICTRDLQREKEIAHYEQPEELKDDLTALNAKVALLTAKLAKREGKAPKARKEDRSKSKSKKSKHQSKKSTGKNEQKFEITKRKDHKSKSDGSTQSYKTKKCHHCGKPGHIKLECFILHPDKKKKGKKKPHTHHEKTQKVPGGKYTKGQRARVAMAYQCRPVGWRSRGPCAKRRKYRDHE